MDDHQAFNEIHNLQDKPEPNNQNIEMVKQKDDVNENLHHQLLDKELELENERKQKEDLDKLIKEMEKKFV